MAWELPQETVSGAKILVYGKKSSGKTRFSITFPGIAVIDAESGTVWYKKTDDYKKNVKIVSSTMSYVEMENDIYRIQDEHEEMDVRTLITDSVTKIRENMKQAVMLVDEKLYKKKGRSALEASLSRRSYGKIKELSTLHSNLKIDLSKKGVTYIDIAQAKEITENQGDSFVRVGWEPDIQKQGDHDYDLQLFLYTEEQPDGTLKYFAKVEKERLGVFQPGEVIENPHYDMWAAVIEESQGKPVDTSSYVGDLKSAQDHYEELSEIDSLPWMDKISALVTKLSDEDKKGIKEAMAKDGTLPPFEGMTTTQTKKLEAIYNKFSSKI